MRVSMGVVCLRGVVEGASLSTKARAALCAADCSDAHGPLRAAARDALFLLCVQRPRADVKSALQMLDAKTRAKVLERNRRRRRRPPRYKSASPRRRSKKK